MQEITQWHYNIEESKPCTEFSKETVEFFKTNLRINPVTTTTLLLYIQENAVQNDTNLNEIQHLYIESLKNELSDINSIDRLLTLLSLVRWNANFMPQFRDQILRHISEENFRQYRKQILLSLIPHGTPELLHNISDFIQKNEPQKEFKLTPEYMLELCYQDRTHWLLKAALVYKQQLHDMKNVTFKINNFTKQILIMVLIDLTNSPETFDLTSLVHQLSNIFSILDTYTTADDQLHFYITEIKRELTIIKFCLENNCKIMTTSIFSQVLAQSALGVISQVCRLSKVDRYKVSRLLNTNNDFIAELKSLKKANKKSLDSNWDVMTYNSYCAITKIIDTVVNSSEGLEGSQDTVSSLDEVKRLVLSIQPLQNCIEVIENIFSCLFLRFEYFSCQEHSQDYPCGAHSDCSYFYSKIQNKNTKNNGSSNAGFMCNSYTTQLVLNTLKLCLEKLEESFEVDDSETSLRLKKLVKVVNHSIWKLQLVSTLSPDTSPLPLKLCLDYVEVDDSSEDENRELELKAFRKKPKSRKKINNAKHETDQVMFASTVSDESKLLIFY